MYTKLCKLTRFLILFCLLASFAWNPASSKAQNQAANAPVPILEQIDRFGGAISDFARNGDILYISVGQHIFVVDFSDPYSPVLLGQSRMLPAGIEAIDYKDGILYAAANIAGVLVLDVSQPSAPVLIGSLEGISYADSLTVSGEKLLVMDEIHRLVIFDISSPADPEQIGEYLSCPYCEVKGPTIPVQDDLVFLIDDTGCAGQTYGCISRLLLVSIADHANPMLLSSFCGSPGGIAKPHLIHSLVVSGQYVYASYSYAAPVIIDISDPASPQQIYRLDDYPWASNLAYYAGYLFLSTSIQRVVINVSDPTQPTEIGRFGDALGSQDVAGNSLFSIYEGTLSAWDLTDPTAPQDTGTIFHSPFAYLHHLVLDKTRIYAYGPVEISILDISFPEIPELLSTYRSAEYINGLGVNGDYIYYTNQDSLHILDISDPYHPLETGILHFSLNGLSLRTVAVSQEFVFLVDIDNGLRIVDVSDTTYPKEVGLIQYPPYSVSTVGIQGKYLYLPMRDGFFRIFDVSDPIQPVETGFVYIPGGVFASQIIISGRFVYITWNNELNIYDVSNPYSPYLVNNSLVLNSNSGFTIHGRFLYSGSGSTTYGEIQIKDVYIPANPVEVATYMQPAGVLDVGFSTDQLWTADQIGLGLLRLLREEASARIQTYGGSLEPPSGAARFVVPGRTFSHDVDLTYHRLYYDQPPANRIGIGQTFELTAEIVGTDAPAALEPGRTISMTLYYTPTELGPAIEDTLGLYIWDGSTWTPEPSSGLDTQANLLTASVDHLGMWAVFGDTLRTYLPISAWNP